MMQQAESSIHRAAVRERAGNVGLQENQIGSGHGPAVVLASNEALHFGINFLEEPTSGVVRVDKQARGVGPRRQPARRRQRASGAASMEQRRTDAIRRARP